MDPNIDARLKSIEEKLEKTYNLVSRVRKVQRNSQLFKIFYWVLILLATFGAFYYIQPYLSQLLNVYTGGDGTSGKNLQDSIPNVQNINEILNQLKGGGSQ